jgi:hypothetical protein
VRNEASNRLTELWQEIGRFCAAILAAAVLVAAYHLFTPIALTNGNVGKLYAYVGHHGVCFNVLQGQGQLVREESIPSSGSYLLCDFIFFISGSQVSVRMSYINYKPSMVRLSYCKEDTSGYSPVSNIFCKCAAILHRLQIKGKLVRLLILCITQNFGDEIHGRKEE